MRNRRAVAFAFADFLLVVLLCYLSAGFQGHGGEGEAPEEIIIVSADARTVTWRGRTTEAGLFDPKPLTGVRKVGLLVDPAAPADRVIDIQLKLQEVVPEIAYATD